MLNGKVALVTGGGQGLGEAFAKCFAANGAKLVVVDLKKSTAESVAHAIEADGGDAIAVQTDVADVGQIEAMAKRALGHFGAVDILVNSAGVFDVVSIDDTTEAVWDRGLDGGGWCAW
jgi:NAD(P)-dependent dehydrogenase (short-subunit alcohol dehydrogenase family)